MHLSLSDLFLDPVPDTDPTFCQQRFTELLAAHRCDAGAALAVLVAESREAQRQIDQAKLTTAFRRMDDAIDTVRHEHDWLTIGSAARFVRMRRETIWKAVHAGTIASRAWTERGQVVRHVRRDDILNWAERQRSATPLPIREPFHLYGRTWRWA